jgi:dTDP-glucose pyrophosphorylase
MKLLIPMAGEGSRFREKGYELPKPLIDVDGQPMIKKVIDNFDKYWIDEYIFICRREHEDLYQISEKLQKFTNNKSKVVFVDKLTEGAACTTLLAKELINNEEPLLLANSDQYVEWNCDDFIRTSLTSSDGCILTFESTNPKWSYAKVNELNLVVEVAEKKVISNLATVGIYYWKHGSDYVKYAKQMIEKNIRVNNEFYVCPVYNQAIEDDKKIITFNADKMWGLGIPEDLEFYLENNERIKNKKIDIEKFQTYCNMQLNVYEECSKEWDIDNRDHVVGSFDKHNNWNDYNKLLFANIDLNKTNSCLDFGCGPGRNIVKYNNFFEKFDGIDICENNLINAKKWIEHNNLNIDKTSLFKTNGYDLQEINENSYDLIISTITMQHICVYSIRYNLFKEMFRVLRNSGSITIQMGYGKSQGLKDMSVNYYDNFFEAHSTNGGMDVMIENYIDIKNDLLEIGFDNFNYYISKVGPGDKHQHWIFFSAQKVINETQ